MQFRCFIYLLPFCAAVWGIVLFNAGHNTPSSGRLLSSQWSEAGRTRNVDESIPTIQDVSTKVFRNQYDAKKNAKLNGGYFLADYENGGWDWVPLAQGQDPPAEEMVVADHLFELQMLTLWMNKKAKIDTGFFTQDQLKTLKTILNGQGNCIYISADLNCDKASVVYQAMIDAIGSKPCTNQLNTPINAYVGYLKTHIEGTRAAIQQVISQKDPGLAQGFADITWDVIQCLSP